MEQVFLRILETGIATGGIILLILPLCFVLKRTPKMVSYLLWIFVFVRLACPVEFSSPVGLMPSIQLNSLLGEEIEEGETDEAGKTAAAVLDGEVSDDRDRVLDDTAMMGRDASSVEAETKGRQDMSVSDDTHQDAAAQTEDGSWQYSSDRDAREGITGNESGIAGNSAPGGLSGGMGRRIIRIASILWLGGICVMGFYGIYQALKLRKILAAARSGAEEAFCHGTWGNVSFDGMEKQTGRVFFSDQISVPFVFGLFRPAIYLPEDLPEESRGYVLLHEQTHIRHRDYLVKYGAYALLCLYWFQPLVWLAYWMLERNMEFACDECVLARLNGEKKQYSMALLELAAGYESGKGKQRLPVAFSEKNTKSRIQNIVQYRRPGKAAVVFLGVLVLAAVFCLMTSRQAGHRDTDIGTGVVQEDDSAGIPCIITDGDGNFTAAKRFKKVRAIELSYTADFPGVDKKYSIQENTFAGCGNLERIVVPGDEIEYVAENAFDGCAPDLVVCCRKDTYLQKRMDEIGVKWMDLEEIWQEEAARQSTESGGDQQEAASVSNNTTPHMLITSEGEILAVSYDLSINKTSIDFPPETKIIGNSAFSNIIVEGPLKIPAEVTEIKDSAFCNAVVEKVVFEGNKLKKIGAGAFTGAMLKEIELPEGIEEIGENAFALTEITDITLPSSMKKLDDSPFGILQSITVLSRDVEYYGDWILSDLPEADVHLTVHCYKGSTTEAYVQSHILESELKYMKEPESSDGRESETDQDTKENTSQSQTALDQERRKAAEAVTSTVNGHREGDMTLEHSPWEIRWWADVTGDGVSDEIIVFRPWDRRKRFAKPETEIYQVDVVSGASGNKIWTYRLDGGYVMRLGLYYKDGKTYLVERKLEYIGKKPKLYFENAYRVFQLDEKGEMIFYDKDRLKFLSKKTEKYQDEEKIVNQKANNYMKASDLIIQNICGHIVCSVPLQRRDMYGFSD